MVKQNFELTLDNFIGNRLTPADSGIHVTDIVENEDGLITAKFYYSTNE